MILEEMRRRVRRHLGNRSDLVQEDIDESLNSHLEILSDAFEFEAHEIEEVIDIGVGVGEIERPENMRVINAVQMLDPWKRDKMRKTYRDALLRETPLDGMPDRFAEFGGKILLYPTPDTQVTLRLIGRKILPQLVEDHDEPVIPKPWHKVLVLYASSELAFEYAMDDRGMSLKNQALSRISVITEHRTLRRRDEEAHIRIDRRKP